MVYIEYQITKQSQAGFILSTTANHECIYCHIDAIIIGSQPILHTFPYVIQKLDWKSRNYSKVVCFGYVAVICSYLHKQDRFIKFFEEDVITKLMTLAHNYIGFAITQTVCCHRQWFLKYIIWF